MFFPALLFVLAGAAALQSFTALPTWYLESLQALDKEWRILAISFTTIVVTGLLYNLNVQILRLYEGYPWKDSLPGKALCRVHTRRFNRLTEEIPQLRLIRDRWKEIDTSHADAKSADALQRQYSIEVAARYPMEGFTLPTSFGNVIRAFESYPQVQYGMSAIAFWPRLAGVADKDYLATVDESKMPVDFFVNASFLSACLGFIIALAGALNTVLKDRVDSLPWWVGQTVLAWLVSILFYRSAVASAASWGATVKGTFDLYRFKLLEKLGYTADLSTREAERTLWTAISQQVVIGNPPFGPPQPYKTAPATTPDTAALPEPAGIELQILKAAESIDARRTRFRIRVRNVDSQNRAATQIRLVEKIPPDLLLEWGSARVNQNPIQNLSGLGTITFELGPLANGHEAILEYSAFLRKPENPA